MENKNMGLPSLPSMDGNTEPLQLSEMTEDQATRMAYKQWRMDQECKTGVYKRIGAPVITMTMLETAPNSFFKRFDDLTERIRETIVRRITESKNTVHISNHKEDPTNPVFKERILNIVMSEFNKMDGRDDEIMILSTKDKDILLALVVNAIIGLGPLEPLWNESRVTEIMCNGPYDIQVEVDGIVKRISSVSFRDEDHLMSLINKLYASLQKQLSPTNPYERGRLHDNSRLYAVHQVICPSGPNLNIRKHSDQYWTVLDIINQGTASPELMEYLGNMIHAGVSYLVVGGTGTGKTTLLNALTGFIPEHARVVTLEENLEMKPHPLKLIAAPMECLPAKAGDDNEFGVTMRDLVRSSLQMRPDQIFIGEVSDGAAFYLCQALNTGHTGASTVHANNSKDSVNRLRSLVSQEELVKGSAVLDLIGSAFDIIIVVDRLATGSRRITEVVELGRDPIKLDNGELSLSVTDLWKCNFEEVTDENDKVSTKCSWSEVGELSDYRKDKHRLSMVEPLSWDELLELSTYNVSPELRKGGK